MRAGVAVDAAVGMEAGAGGDAAAGPVLGRGRMRMRAKPEVGAWMLMRVRMWAKM